MRCEGLEGSWSLLKAAMFPCLLGSEASRFSKWGVFSVGGEIFSLSAVFVLMAQQKKGVGFKCLANII